jgi:hypothetical protein
MDVLSGLTDALPTHVAISRDKHESIFRNDYY